MSLVHVNGCDFACEQIGGGADLIFIHGEIHGLAYWEYQLPDFTRDHRCFIYNRRGHVGSGMPDYGFSLVNQTRDLAALIEHHQIKNPVIVAVAFGTTIAANYALQFPDQVRGLVLAAWSEMHDAMLYFHRWAGYNQIAVDILERSGRDALNDHLRAEGGRSIYKVIPVDSPIREKCVHMFASHPIDEYRRGMLEFATSVPDLVTPFSRLSVPVLGICGANDPYPDQPERLQGMARFVEAAPIAGAGRCVHGEQPAAFNAAVRDFLGTI